MTLAAYYMKGTINMYVYIPFFCNLLRWLQSQWAKASRKPKTFATRFEFNGLQQQVSIVLFILYRFFVFNLKFFKFLVRVAPPVWVTLFPNSFSWDRVGPRPPDLWRQWTHAVHTTATTTATTTTTPMLLLLLLLPPLLLLLLPLLLPLLPLLPLLLLLLLPLTFKHYYYNPSVLFS